MKLEDSNGDVLDPVGREELATVLDRIGRDRDFCILSSGDDYIQTADADGGLVVEYQDAGGHFEGAEGAVSPAAVKDIFTAYLEGGSWKEKVSWTLQESGGSTGGGPGDGDRSGENRGGLLDGNLSAEGIKDSLIRAAKSEAGRGLSSAIRKGIRKFLG